MKPNPSQEFYDWLADEAIDILIQDKNLEDKGEFLSCDIVKAWKRRESEK